MKVLFSLQTHHNFCGKHRKPVTTVREYKVSNPGPVAARPRSEMIKT